LPREHPSELGLPHAPLERGHERLGLVNRRRVVPLRAEVEEDLRVVDVAPKLLERRDGLLEARALARDGLRLLRVVPEPRDKRLLAEAVDFLLQLREVKDAPLAP
jgi:hypothetical protein